MEFYCVQFEWDDRTFFRDKEHAKNYLWSEYLENTDDDAETTESHLKELEKEDFIDGVGVIYTYEFND